MSVESLVVIVTLVPATRVNESFAVSATTLFCPDTIIVLNEFPPALLSVQVKVPTPSVLNICPLVPSPSGNVHVTLVVSAGGLLNALYLTLAVSYNLNCLPLVNLTASAKLTSSAVPVMLPVTDSPLVCVVVVTTIVLSEITLVLGL